MYYLNKCIYSVFLERNNIYLNFSYYFSSSNKIYLYEQRKNNKKKRHVKQYSEYYYYLKKKKEEKAEKLKFMNYNNICVHVHLANTRKKIQLNRNENVIFGH
jgi:hypothetical protein